MKAVKKSPEDAYLTGTLTEKIINLNLKRLSTIETKIIGR
jgi:hypothetical protein